jgi:hypothetical protein
VVINEFVVQGQFVAAMEGNFSEISNMKTRIFLFALLLCGFAQAQNSYQTLFLGNSYTGVNDLPSIVQSLTLAGGDTLYKDSNTPGGYTFQGHSTNGTSLSLIRAKLWDFVVLQEQSQLPSFPQGQVQSDVYPYAAILNDSIKANDSCTVTVFYMTWGRKFGDAGNCQFWPPVCTYAGMQAELRRSYLNLANQNNALVAPCGSAWWESILRDSTLELYSPDQSHPSYAGSYLTGCVFYATMYRRSPIGLNFYGGLDTTTAVFLQQVAHDVVFDSLAQWRIGLDDAAASFTFTANSAGEANFNNSSFNANNYQWNFGDGGSDSVANPTHVYANSGQYLVTLIAANGCTSDTLTDTVEVILVGRQDPKTFAMSVSPNPSNGVFEVLATFSSDESISMTVHDFNGKCIHTESYVLQNGQLIAKLNLESAQAGIYLLTLRGADGQFAAKRLVIH